ncbi:hypothetical protein BGX27_003882, partial [Mortierella sp. AM989]
MADGKQRDTGGLRQKRKPREHEPGLASTLRQSRKFTAADVNEHQRRVTNYAIANAQAEAAAHSISPRSMPLEFGVPKFQNINTSAWCERKRYSDTNVTYSKFLTYLQELVAENAVIDENDDYYSINPLRIKVKPGYGGDLPGVCLIEAHVTAIVDLHGQQTSLTCQPRSGENSSLRTREVAAVIQKYKLRY